ncbi:MAG: hypothetical protein GY757_08780 [bacterium]|nr:hypothetical protein [bacterium]
MKFENEYLEGGVNCPHCGSENATITSDPAASLGQVSVERECLECRNNWFDEYELVGIR